MLACKELSKMPEANYLLSVSWGYIKVGLIPEGLLIPELLMGAFFFVLCCLEKASERKICFKNPDFCVFWLIMCVVCMQNPWMSFFWEVSVAG